MPKSSDSEFRLPAVVRASIAFLLPYVQTKGLFRVPGVASDIEKLTKKFRSGKDINLTKKQYDPHTIAGLLKRFFRDLDEPLLTLELYDCFLAAVAVPDDDIQLQCLSKVVSLLPTVNYFILAALLEFLVFVSSFSDVNCMAAANLGVVFAPSLLRSSALDPCEQLADSQYSVSVIEQLINHFRELFPVDVCPLSPRSQRRTPSQIKMERSSSVDSKSARRLLPKNKSTGLSNSMPLNTNSPKHQQQLRQMKRRTIRAGKNRVVQPPADIPPYQSTTTNNKSNVVLTMSKPNVFSSSSSSSSSSNAFSTSTPQLTTGPPEIPRRRDLRKSMMIFEKKLQRGSLLVANHQPNYEQLMVYRNKPLPELPTGAKNSTSSSSSSSTSSPTSPTSPTKPTIPPKPRLPPKSTINSNSGPRKLTTQKRKPAPPVPRKFVVTTNGQTTVTHSHQFTTSTSYSSSPPSAAERPSSASFLPPSRPAPKPQPVRGIRPLPKAPPRKPSFKFVVERSNPSVIRHHEARRQEAIRRSKQSWLEKKLSQRPGTVELRRSRILKSEDQAQKNQQAQKTIDTFLRSRPLPKPPTGLPVHPNQH